MKKKNDNEIVKSKEKKKDTSYYPVIGEFILRVGFKQRSARHDIALLLQQKTL